MAWLPWRRSRATESRLADGRCVGIDIDATRLRASVLNEVGPSELLLERDGPELPMAVCLEGKAIVVGSEALGQIRRLPHAVVTSYLPLLGYPHEWTGSRHRMNATGAVAITLDTAGECLIGATRIGAALPGYLTANQLERLTGLLAERHWPIVGTVASSLALAAARPPTRKGDAKDIWVLEVDESAFTATEVRCSPSDIRIVRQHTEPRLGLAAWRQRLIDAVSDRCVRTCRRDPRDSADTEQMLFDQLDPALDRLRYHGETLISLRCANWYQDLAGRADDWEAFAAPLLRPLQAMLRDLFAGAGREVMMSHAFGRLPGVRGIVQSVTGEGTNVRVLPADAVSSVAALCAKRWELGTLAPGHYRTALPIPNSAIAPAVSLAPTRKG